MLLEYKCEECNAYNEVDGPEQEPPHLRLRLLRAGLVSHNEAYHPGPDDDASMRSWGEISALALERILDERDLT